MTSRRKRIHVGKAEAQERSQDPKSSPGPGGHPKCLQAVSCTIEAELSLQILMQGE